MDPSEKKLWTDIPKVELHLHLEGSVRFSTVIEEYGRHGLPLPHGDESDLREYFLTLRPQGSLAKFLEKFKRTQVIFRDKSTIRRVAEECVLDRYSHGVRLLEIRYAPSYMSLGHEHLLSWESIHEAIKEGIQNALTKIGNDNIAVGLICIAVGVYGSDAFRKTVDFAIAHKDDFIGFDIAGAEESHLAFVGHMDRVHMAGIPITVHAAEDESTGNPTNAIIAVEQLHARRIGHGIQIIKDEAALQFIKGKDILLEVAPFSNWITGGVKSLLQHPIKQLYARGVRVCISTDDPGIMDLDINDEYRLLHNTMNFTAADFLRMNLWAIEASFIHSSAKARIQEKYFNKENNITSS